MQGQDTLDHTCIKDDSLTEEFLSQHLSAQTVKCYSVLVGPGQDTLFYLGTTDLHLQVGKVKFNFDIT